MDAEKAKKMAERKDYYAILSVVKDASTRDVKQVQKPTRRLWAADAAAVHDFCRH